ncbi:MAG TPA: hypothetical protein PLE81_07110 [Brevundimonas sp.]|jgi:hypothetical protein|uniref:CC_3452 family protein n=1 Tax=Brevundimonas sp. TaxID=1871086 RepID=UPI002D09A583|nr:hypothetical protein [Brevundimonas sp.]HRH20393.1 hypothetical protein [Brevundimonas sp.]
MRIASLMAVAALAVAGAASAQSTGTSLTLQNAAAAPATPTVVDGVNWRCEPTGACVGVGRGTEQPATRACRRVVAQLGAVSSFSWRGRSLDAAQLAACNAAAG